MERVLDGELHGRIAHCAVCGRGQPKIAQAGDTNATCSGYYDSETSSRIPCGSSVSLEKIHRVQPWFSSKPTEEEEEMMDKEADQAAGITNDDDDDGDAGADGQGGGNSKDDDNTKLLLKKAAGLKKDWDLPSDATAPKIKAATKRLLDVVMSEDVPKLSIPEGKEKMEIGKTVLMSKGESAEFILRALRKRFPFAQAKAAAAKKRAAAVESVCVNTANGGIMNALLELSELYFKEKNSNAGATYRKVANAIKDIEFEITQDNAKGLGKGKTKVANIGKSSADKIYEFVTTGTMAKLEEKRAAALAS